jgi:hypothetical protein
VNDFAVTILIATERTAWSFFSGNSTILSNPSYLWRQLENLSKTYFSCYFSCTTPRHCIRLHIGNQWGIYTVRHISEIPYCMTHTKLDQFCFCCTTNSCLMYSTNSLICVNKP